MIYLDTVLDRAGDIYRHLKRKKGQPMPTEIVSDQVKALAEALVEEFNRELVVIKSKLRGDGIL